MVATRQRGVGIGGIVWLLIGLLVAAAHHYFNNAGSLRPLVSAILAVILWPLLLLGINLHVH